jgi:hypothetical protein
VKLSKDQSHGDIYGLLVWRGKAKSKPIRIGPALKKQWQLVDTPDYSHFNGSWDEACALAPATVEEAQ